MEYPYYSTCGNISLKRPDDSSYTYYTESRALKKSEYKYAWNAKKIEGTSDSEPEEQLRQRQLNRINYWMKPKTPSGLSQCLYDSYKPSKLVLKKDLKDPLPCNDEKEFLTVSFDLPNQNVIRNDCDRTRNKEFKDSLKSELELFLTFYCKKENIVYKQGLNEVAAPFILFRYLKIPLFSCYNMFHLFINRYLPNLFVDEDFLGLQCWFYLFSCLMRYHDPYMNHFLTIHYLTPELYATPWFLTLFASKTRIEILYLLWDLYMLEDDPTFVLFLALALINLNKAQLFSSDVGNLPQLLSNLSITSIPDLKKVFQKALEFKSKTPASFFLKVRYMSLFKVNRLGSEAMKRNINRLENNFCLTVTPAEILKSLYPNLIPCVNLFCPSVKNMNIQNLMLMQHGIDGYGETQPEEELGTVFKTIAPIKPAYLENFNILRRETEFDECDNRELFSPEDEKIGCSFCTVQLLDCETQKRITEIDAALKDFIVIWEENKMGSFVSSFNFQPIDLRRNRKPGFLHSSHLIPITSEKQDITNLPINDMIEHKGIYHFCFVITDFDGNLPKQDGNSKNKMLNSLPTNIDELSEEESEKILLRKFVKDFCENGFPYISILRGGFKVCHNILSQMGLKIQGHNEEDCNICNSRKKSGGIMDFINKVFNIKSTPDNKDKEIKKLSHSGSSKNGDPKPPHFGRQNSEGDNKYNSPGKEKTINREIRSTELCSTNNMCETNAFPNSWEGGAIRLTQGESSASLGLNTNIQFGGGLFNRIPTFPVNSTLSSEGSTRSLRSVSDIFMRTYPDSERNIREKPESSHRNFSHSHVPAKDTPNILVNNFSPGVYIERKGSEQLHGKEEIHNTRKHASASSHAPFQASKLANKSGDSAVTSVGLQPSSRDVKPLSGKEDLFLGVPEVFGFYKKEERPKEKSIDGRYSLGIEKEPGFKTGWTKINEVRNWEAYLGKSKAQWENKPVFSNLSLLKIGESPVRNSNTVYPAQHHAGHKLSMPMNSYYGPPSNAISGDVFDSESYFNRNGIMSEIKASRADWIRFLNYLREKDFQAFRCNAIKEKVSDEIRHFLTPKQTSGMNHKVSRRILILFADILLVVKYTPDVESSLNHIKLNPQKDASSFSWSSHYGEKPSALQKENQSHLPYGKIPSEILFPSDKSNVIDSSVQIKSFFLMKSLIKITSKKNFSTILSFYFRLPNISRTITLENNNYYSFLLNLSLPQIMSFLDSGLKEDFLKDFIKSPKEEIKLEGRCVLDLLLESNAKICIDRTKELYLEGTKSSEQS